MVCPLEQRQNEEQSEHMIIDEQSGSQQSTSTCTPVSRSIIITCHDIATSHDPNEETSIAVKVAHEIKHPTLQEQREHSALHVPFRAWCAHCMAGRGHEKPHTHRMEQEPSFPPRIEMDYAFVRAENETDEVTVLLVTHVQSQYSLACQVAHKGRDHQAVRIVLKFLHECGIQGRLIVRTDRETSMQRLSQMIANARGDQETILETTSPGSSSSLGSAERWSQTMSGLVRTYASVLFSEYHVQIQSTSCILPWLIRHCSWIANRYQPHQRLQGRTAYEERRNHAFRRDIFPFATPIMAMLPYATGRAKFQEGK